MQVIYEIRFRLLKWGVKGVHPLGYLPIREREGVTLLISKEYRIAPKFDSSGKKPPVIVTGDDNY